MKSLILLDNISKSFTFANGTKREVLKDLYLEIFPNDFIGIKGPSGAGKTTLLKIISGFLTPDTGHITYSNCTKENLTFLWQDTKLVPFLNVMENLMEMENANWYHFQEFIEETIIDKYPEELSKGQSQRVLLAKAFSGTKRILFLDEPTANLDLINVKKIAAFLKQMINNGLTVVFVSHSKMMLETADKVYELSSGRLRPVVNLKR